MTMAGLNGVAATWTGPRRSPSFPSIVCACKACVVEERWQCVQGQAWQNTQRRPKL